MKSLAPATLKSSNRSCFWSRGRPACSHVFHATVRFRKPLQPSSQPNLEIRITQTKIGAKAAVTTTTRKRMILHNAMAQACETGVLDENPLSHIRWTWQRATTEVDQVS